MRKYSYREGFSIFISDTANIIWINSKSGEIKAIDNTQTSMTLICFWYVFRMTFKLNFHLCLFVRLFIFYLEYNCFAMFCYSW